jgi:hypothetical protein
MVLCYLFKGIVSNVNILVNPLTFFSGALKIFTFQVTSVLRLEMVGKCDSLWNTVRRVSVNGEGEKGETAWCSYCSYFFS